MEFALGELGTQLCPAVEFLDRALGPRALHRRTAGVEDKLEREIVREALLPHGDPSVVIPSSDGVDAIGKPAGEVGRMCAVHCLSFLDNRG